MLHECIVFKLIYVQNDQMSIREIKETHETGQNSIFVNRLVFPMNFNQCSYPMTLFCKFLAKNCTKMKEFGPWEGGCIPGAPLEREMIQKRFTVFVYPDKGQ